MGISSDGQLVFGIPFEEEEQLPAFMCEGDMENDDDWFEDFEDYICTEMELPLWRGGMTDEESSKFFKDQREAVENYPVDLVLHCSYDYSMYILAVRGKSYSASRGSVEGITPVMLEVTDEQKAALKAWCEKRKIEWQEPKWFLCSLYG